MQRLLSLLLLCVLALGLMSCGGNDDDDNDPIQPEVTVPFDPADPENEDDDERGNRNRVLKTTECYSEPRNVAYLIRKEKKRGENAKFFLYDCPGGRNTCTRAFQIKTTETRRPDGGNYNCLTHVSDPGVFDMCDTGEVHSSEPGSRVLDNFEGTRNATFLSFDCERNFPKHDTRNDF